MTTHGDEERRREGRRKGRCVYTGNKRKKQMAREGFPVLSPFVSLEKGRREGGRRRERHCEHVN